MESRLCIRPLAGAKVSLAQLVVRVERESMFCAAGIAEFRDRRGWTNAQVAERLRCDAATLERIALCLAPTGRGVIFEEDEHGWWAKWRSEVANIAAFAGVRADDLESILNDEERNATSN